MPEPANQNIKINRTLNMSMLVAQNGDKIKLRNSCASVNQEHSKPSQRTSYLIKLRASQWCAVGVLSTSWCRLSSAPLTLWKYRSV